MDYWGGHNNPHDYDYDDDFNPRRHRVMATPERKRREVPKWNGQPVRKMDSEHIMNAILYCERKFVEARDNHYKAYSESFVELKFYFDSVADMYPDYVNLRNEWNRRKEL